MEYPQLKRLLVIDDDSFIVQLLSLVLKKLNYDVITASNGKDAIAILAEQSVELIIVDLMMPEMDGLDFLHWLRQEAKLVIPALVLTGMVTGDTETQVMAAGATALLHKPIKTTELLAKIKQFEHPITIR